MAFWHERVMRMIFRDMNLQIWSAVSSGGVFILCPRAQDGDSETRGVREGRGWYRHRCNLRDSEELFFSCVVALNYESSRLNSWPFPLLLLTPSLPTPTILCFVAWINIVLYLLHINSSYVSSWQNEIGRFGIVLTAHFLFLVPIFFQSIKFYYRPWVFLYFKGGWKIKYLWSAELNI